MASAAFEVFFLPPAVGGGRQRFCVFHPPQGGQTRGAVLHVPALFEEMNKSRRMVALQSRALAAHGWAVLQIDLFGCGDSGGSIENATWQDWLNDVELGARWLVAAAPGPLWLWGLRGGALLASQAAARCSERCNLLLWQPVMQGRQLLQQMLRLRVAHDMLGGVVGADDPRADWTHGRSVMLGGYAIGGPLAAGIEATQLLPPAVPGRSVWIDVRSQPGAAVAPAWQAAAARWAAAGRGVGMLSATGPSFWQTTEIETAPDLLNASLQAVAHDERLAA